MEDLDPKYKREGWTIPEAYFESLEDKVFKRLKNEKPKSKTHIIKWRKPVAIAASLAVIVLITILSYRSARTEDTEISFNDLDSMDIANFENNEELNDEEFEEFVPEAVVDSLYNTRVKAAYVNTYISKEELQDLEEEYSILDDETEI